MTRYFPIVLSMLAALIGSLPASLHGAEPESPVRMTIHPSAAAKPALRYRLLPSFLEKKPGNAAVPYGKVTAEEMTFFGRQEWRDKVERWQEMPLDQLKSENVVLPSGPIFFLQQGARLRHCDWQLPIGQVPFYKILLPEAQQSRSYARVLAVKARQEIAQGRFEDAVETFQTGIALGQNVAEGETLVNGLIGIAICRIMFEQLSEYMQQPDSPNLYWALTTLPVPLIDMRKALDVESQGVELSFPELMDVATAERSPDEWRVLFHRFARQVVEWGGSGESQAMMPSPEELDTACKKLHPRAKRALIESGLPRSKVESMALHHVALVYALQLHHELFDEAVKSYMLQYPQAEEAINAAAAKAERAKRDGRELIPLTTQVLPAIRATRIAIARTDRQVAVLRVIEALRIYAADHGGRLPEQLSDVTSVPVPLDPVTSKPFNYRREGDRAFLQGPALQEVALKYKLTLAGDNR